MLIGLSERGRNVIYKAQGKIDTAESHMLARDALINKWNKKESTHPVLPAPVWKRGDRVVSIFSNRALITLFLSFVLGGIPFLILLPFGLRLATRRKMLSNSILREHGLIHSILPIPLDEEDFKMVLKSEKGRVLIEEGIIFENSYIKKGVQ